MRVMIVPILGLASVHACAQVPDVKIKGDISVGMTSSKEFSLGAQSYTPLGRHSTISLQAMLPVGLKVNLSERIQVIKNDTDDDAFDEYYVEDTGSWRLGKQYVPFGGGAFFRQSVLSARIDSNLLLEGLPLSLALADAGQGRQYGVIGRIGGRGFGISFCIGRHWGVNSSSLALTQSVQMPEGRGNGWKQAFGMDVTRRSGKFTFRSEGILLRGAEGTSVDKEVADFHTNFDLGHRHSAQVGVSKVLNETGAFYRVGGIYNAAKGIQLEGNYRLKDGNFRDFSVFLRVRF